MSKLSAGCGDRLRSIFCCPPLPTFKCIVQHISHWATTAGLLNLLPSPLPIPFACCTSSQQASQHTTRHCQTAFILHFGAVSQIAGPSVRIDSWCMQFTEGMLQSKDWHPARDRTPRRQYGRQWDIHSILTHKHAIRPLNTPCTRRRGAARTKWHGQCRYAGTKEAEGVRQCPGKAGARQAA